MLEKYSFILPIFFVWLVFIFIPVVLVFYTSLGLRHLPVLNRTFMRRLVSITLFVVAIAIIFFGLLQLLGVIYEFAGKPSVYWHALIGYLLILTALNHMAIHIKDIYRYVFKRRPKQEVQ